MLFVTILLLFFMTTLGRQHVQSASTYEIGGFYLGATPNELNIKVEIESLQGKKYFETQAGDVHLFFVKVQGKFRLYRITKEQNIKSENIKSVLDSLKARYGTPDKQQIKTSSIRPQNRAQYITTVKNRAIWKISKTQEFIAEIESMRVVYELLDSDPENIKASGKPGATEKDETGPGGWKSDF